LGLFLSLYANDQKKDVSSQTALDGVFAPLWGGFIPGVGITSFLLIGFNPVAIKNMANGSII
jgi:hypothetical protein